jgi:oleate hydratase
MPIIRFLHKQGVDFRLCTKVTGIATLSDCGTETVSAIHVLRDSFRETITVCADDIVLVSLGSDTSGSSSGTNKSPPFPKTMIAENDLDENWSLWLNLRTQHPTLGDPYNFCTRVTESRLEIFTVTLKDAEFFNRFVKLTCDDTAVGRSVCVSHVNHFSRFNPAIYRPSGVMDFVQNMRAALWKSRCSIVPGRK